MYVYGHFKGNFYFVISIVLLYPQGVHRSLKSWKILEIEIFVFKGLEGHGVSFQSFKTLEFWGFSRVRLYYLQFATLCLGQTSLGITFCDAAITKSVKTPVLNGSRHAHARSAIF